MEELLMENMEIIVNKDGSNVVAKSSFKYNDYFFTGLKYSEYFYNIDNITFIGIARLKKNDTNNLENAKKIAIWKMRRQFFKYIARCMKDEKSQYEKKLETTNNGIEKLTNTIESIDRKIIDAAYYKQTPKS